LVRLAVKTQEGSKADMSEKMVQSQQPMNRAERIVVGMIAGSIVTAVVLPATITMEGEEPLFRAVVGFVAGMILGAVGGITGGVVRGIFAGLVVGAILMGISAMARPAMGVAGELRSFDPGSIKGLIGAAIYGMAIGSIGGCVGGAINRLVGPKKRTGSSVL
jgi:hypothetical protein